LEFAELSKSGLSGVGSVGYVNTGAFTMLSYRPSEEAIGGMVSGMYSKAK